MERFLQRHQDRILGVLSGFDRVLFRGTLRSISYVKGFEIFLSSQHVLLKDFSCFVQSLSEQVKEHAKSVAIKHKRPFQYVAASTVSKEELVKSIIKRDGIKNGLVCILSCVEPCQSYDLKKDRQTKHLLVVPAQRKCLHLYFYYMDRDFGLMHIRLQTWLPFTIHICINGREFLARQMDRLGIGYQQRDNCFTRIDDLPRAQKLLDDLTQRRWPVLLNAFARRVNPCLEPKAGLNLHGYYWSNRQTEYATDVMFKDAASLQAIYPRLIDHAIQQFSCGDVLRFLGRRTNSRSEGEVCTDLKRRSEGIRVKHWVEENSIKMYDKGSVLRIETTMNNPWRFKVRRMGTRKGQRCMQCMRLRKGVIDIERLVEICRDANRRYLEALAVVGQPKPVRQLLDPVSQALVRDGRPYRGLRPITSKETDIFRILLRGEHVMQGFRNRDVRHHFYTPVSTDPLSEHRISGQITRWFRLLRAHRLIRKVSGTRYYRVTETGNHVMTTALKLRETDLERIAA